MGLGQLDALYPYLQMKLNQVIGQELEARTLSDGNDIYLYGTRP